MNREEAEQLAEVIRKEAPSQIVVLGIEPLGPVSNPTYATGFFVKCACKVTGLQFVMKSFQQWENLKQHVIIRVCRFVYRLIKR
jgi:hypothetical protein